MKKPAILILTGPEDAHAMAVAAGLRKKGVEPIMWFTTDYPKRSYESVAFRGGLPEISIDLESSDLARIDTVWHRRPAYSIDRELLDPADAEYADIECKLFREALLELLAPDAFWVNPRRRARRTSLKPWQHQQALHAGLRMPDTLYSNDPRAIRRFIRDHGGTIAFKPLGGELFVSEEVIAWPCTTLLREDDLVDDRLMRQVPAIYQQLLPKAYELRVTVMGRYVSAAKIDSQRTDDGRIDWRRASGRVTLEATELPVDLKRQILRLMERLHLVFGTLDFVVTPAGETYFLEINQMGQFLFVEEETGVPLLDAFCEFLIEGRPDFEGTDGRHNAICYSEMYAEVCEAIASAEASHEATPSLVIPE